MNPYISVIIPCYNVEKYLARCIESILNQEFKELEIILIDDGSPDNCGAICDNFANIDSRIVVIHQKNMGLSGARNTGINIAKGEYILFVDSDDILFPNALSILYSAALKYCADLVSCEYIKGSDISKICQKGNNEVIVGNGAYVLDYVLRNSSWSAWGKLYKRNLIGDERFLLGHVYEDFEFVPRQFIKASKCVHCCTELYFYFDNDAGIMGSTKSVLKPYYIDFAVENLNYINKSVYNEIEKEKVCAGFYMHFMWDYNSPMRMFSKSQTKDFKRLFRLFLKQIFKNIIKNKYLPNNIKARYICLRFSSGLFDLFCRFNYLLKGNKR